MGLRFRHSVRLFPGVRLNFSGGGISTTIGVRGASVNLGPRGTYLNLGVPGTGLSYRTKVTSTENPPPSGNGELAPTLSPQFSPSTPLTETEGVRVIQSAEVSALTSPGLSELKRLINEASVSRAKLVHDVSARELELKAAERKLSLARTFIVRLFTRRLVPKLASAAQETSVKLEEARAQLSGCYVEIDFAFDDVTHSTYAALIRAFEALKSCEKIWDITSTVATNRVVQRTLATQSLARTPVAFDFAHSDIIKSQHQAMRLGNMNGLDLQIFPGFVLMRDKGGDFALIELRELDFKFGQSQFIEEEKLPSDSEVVGHTWRKTNKDGSPDRRFKDNYQIPIARYGEYQFKSSTGVNEAYHLSSYSKSETFAAAFEAHKRAIANLASRAIAPDTIGSSSTPTETVDDAFEHTQPTSAAESLEAPRYLFVDWIALALMLVCFGAASFWAADRDQAQKIIQNLGLAEFEPSPPQQQIAPMPANGAPAPSTQTFAYVVAPVAIVRAEPSSASLAIRREKKGARFTTFQRKGSWTQVGGDEPIGWVFNKSLGEGKP